MRPGEREAERILAEHDFTWRAAQSTAQALSAIPTTVAFGVAARMFQESDPRALALGVGLVVLVAAFHIAAAFWYRRPARGVDAMIVRAMRLRQRGALTDEQVQRVLASLAQQRRHSARDEQQEAS